MKIIHILNEFREIGNGIVNVTFDLACAQSKAGHEVVVISNGGEYVELLRKNGGKHIYLDQKRSLRNLLPMFLEFKKILNSFKPDIVHAHMMTGTVLGKLFKAQYNYKLVTTVHNEYQKSSILMKYGDAVVAVSDAVCAAMKKRGVKESKLFTIKNGTIGSLRRIPLEQLNKAELKRPAILTIGFVSERKGSDILIKAFDAVAKEKKEINLYFVGNIDWPYAQQLAAESLSSDRIHFLGFDPQPQKYLLSADIFVLPSIREPFGLVLIEAREAKLPIIASDIEGIPEALSGGKAGILTPPGDIHALKTAINSFLDSDQLREKYSKKSQIGLEEFHVTHMSDQYINAYKKILVE